MDAVRFVYIKGYIIVGKPLFNQLFMNKELVM